MKRKTDNFSKFYNKKRNSAIKEEFRQEKKAAKRERKEGIERHFQEKRKVREVRLENQAPNTAARPREEVSMSNPLSALPTMLIIWAVVTVCFLLLLAYRGQITRYEEDQLFLNGAQSNEEKEQSEIVRKVNRISPLIRIFGGAASIATLSIVGLFAYDAWQHLK